MTNTRHPEQFRVVSQFQAENGRLLSERNEAASGTTQVCILVGAALKDGSQRIDVERLRDGKTVLRYDIDGFDL